MREQVARCAGGQSVLCALSGGVDSVVLLHLLLQCGVRVEAAHVEHGIRGESSRRDCRFVQELCGKWGVPLHVIHLDVPAQAAKEGRGIEETARAMRYDFLWKTREARRLETLATAHHLNDQAETVLMHLIRGASPVGLSGMRERDGALIRPLLPFSRAQIEQYAQENHLPHVEDETNADIAYTRNYIRHELIPCMEKLNPRAVEAVGRAAELARRQSDFVRQEALRVLCSRMYGAALADVSDLHPGLRSEVIAQYLRAQGTPEFSAADIVRIESLLAGGVGRRVSLGKELFERDTNGVRRVIMEPAGSGRWALHSGENETPLGRFTLRTGKVPKNLNLGKYAQVFDADKIRAPLFVRTRRDGDRLALLGGGKRKLSDILIDKKVPRALRDSVPLIVMGEEILWAVGAAPGKTCAVMPESVQALVIEYQPLKEKNDAVFKG